MIRFGVIVSVVVAAVGLLIVGAIAGDLSLVYVSIALAAAALLMLIVGVAVWRDEVFASSARRDERDLAPVATGGRVAAGPAGPAEWHEWSAPTPGHGSRPGDTRELRAPIGALPERETPAERDRHAGEPRLTEQPLRPAAASERPAREPSRRDRSRRRASTPERPARAAAAAAHQDREAGPGEQPAREQPAAEQPGREQSAGEHPGREQPAGKQPGREQPAREHPGREPGPSERPGREVAAAAAAERAGREAAEDLSRRDTPRARRTDRVERYPTVVASERFEPADDPTRLAHRLDSLADFARPAPPGARPAGMGPTATSPAPGASPPAASPSGVSASAPPASAPAMPAATQGAAGRGQDRPVEPGADRREPAARRTDDVSAASGVSPAGSSVWSRTPSSPDARLPAEPAAADLAGLEFRTSPAIVPGDRDAAPPAASWSAPPPTVPAPAPTGQAAESRADAGLATPAEASAAGAPAPAAAVRAAAVPGGPADAGTTAGRTTSDGEPAVGPDDEVSVVPGIARYHKADCILIRFLGDDDLEVITRRDAESTGCAPCRACRPDRPSASG